MWEECLPHVEFAYGLLSHTPIDLMPLPSLEKLNFDAKQRAKLMLKMHETTKENIEHMNTKYKISGDKGRKQLDFEPGDLVWLHLRKEQFPDLRKSKLMHRAMVHSKSMKRLMRMHISLICLLILGLVPHLILQI
jgi:hypothetical protein